MLFSLLENVATDGFSPVLPGRDVRRPTEGVVRRHHGGRAAGRRRLRLPLRVQRVHLQGWELENILNLNAFFN